MRNRMAITAAVLMLALNSCFGPLDPSDPPPPKEIEDTTATTVRQNGLVVHWACNDSGSILKDETGYCNGYISGATPDSGVDSVSGGGLKFDGAGDIVIVNTSGRDAFNFGTGDFTVSLWVKPMLYQAVTDSTQFDIISNGIAKERGFTISIFRKSFNAFVGQNKNELEDSTFDARDTEWRHLVLRRYNSVVDFYVDTKKILSYDNNNDVTSSDSQIIIGDDASNKDNNRYIGKIDEIKIFDKALDLNDIRNEYNLHT